jgi:hypothetical protein
MRFQLIFFALLAALLPSCYQVVSVQSGKGGGSPASQFQTIPLTRTALVAGGKCIAKLTYKNGELSEVDTDTQGCFVGEAKSPLMVNGQPLQNNAESITFGTGTTTCYGPPIPSPPRCVCTALPCP